MTANDEVVVGTKELSHSEKSLLSSCQESASDCLSSSRYDTHEQREYAQSFLLSCKEHSIIPLHPFEENGDSFGASSRDYCCCENEIGRNHVLGSCPSDCTRFYSTCEVARHNTETSAWLVMGNDIFDVTPFLEMHPGGKQSMLRKSGGVVDCTRDFYFHSRKGQKLWKSTYIGKIRQCPFVQNQSLHISAQQQHQQQPNYSPKSPCSMRNSNVRFRLKESLQEFFHGIMIRIINHRENTT